MNEIESIYNMLLSDNKDDILMAKCLIDTHNFELDGSRVVILSKGSWTWSDMSHKNGKYIFNTCYKLNDWTETYSDLVKSGRSNKTRFIYIKVK